MGNGPKRALGVIKTLEKQLPAEIFRGLMKRDLGGTEVRSEETFAL